MLKRALPLLCQVVLIIDSDCPYSCLLIHPISTDSPASLLLLRCCCHNTSPTGYLALDRGNDLLSTLQHSSAPGSRILVTVPPGPAVKAAKEKAQADAAAAAAHSNNKDTDSKEADTTGSAARVVVVPVVHMGEGAAGGVSTVQANMPHVTFEDPQDTHAR